MASQKISLAALLLWLFSERSVKQGTEGTKY